MHEELIGVVQIYRTRGPHWNDIWKAGLMLYDTEGTDAAVGTGVYEDSHDLDFQIPRLMGPLCVSYRPPAAPFSLPLAPVPLSSSAESSTDKSFKPIGDAAFHASKRTYPRGGGV